MKLIYSNYTLFLISAYVIKVLFGCKSVTACQINSVFVSPAHAIDELQLPSGAEGELVFVAAEGPGHVGADPRGAQPAVSLPAGHNEPASILTRHAILRLRLSASDVLTVPAGAAVDHPKRRWSCPPATHHPSHRLMSGTGGELTFLRTREPMWSSNLKRS